MYVFPTVGKGEAVTKWSRISCLGKFSHIVSVFGNKTYVSQQFIMKLIQKISNPMNKLLLMLKIYVHK